MRRNGLSRHDIIAAIRNRGVTVRELSRRISPTKDSTAVSKALSRPWPRVEAAIAKFLNMQPEEIWPHRYDAAGIPLRNEKISTDGRPAERLNGRAA